MSVNLTGLAPSFHSKNNRPTFVSDPAISTAYSIGIDNTMACMLPIYEPLPTTMLLPETFPEKPQHHQHKVSFPWWRRKMAHWIHNPDVETHIPTTDVRETPTHYYLDVELPGLKDKSKLGIRWTSTRTVLIQASIERPHLPESKDAAHHGEITPTNGEKKAEPKASPADVRPTATATSATSEPSTAAPINGAHKCDICDPSASHPDTYATKIENGTTPEVNANDNHSNSEHASTHVAVGERAIGNFIRNFNFPIDVEYQGVEAKLEAGLLTLTVKKSHTHKVEEGKETVMVH